MSSKKGMFVWIWNNFRQSFSKTKPKGDLIGKDHLGTSYFEIPADPQGGKRKPSRWFQPLDKQAFDQSLPPEWEAWLRGRRTEPPTTEEIETNMAIANLKKIRAKELVEKEIGQSGRKKEIEESPPNVKKAFPTYVEYEIIPGKDQKENG